MSENKAAMHTIIRRKFIINLLVGQFKSMSTHESQLGRLHQHTAPPKPKVTF